VSHCVEGVDRAVRSFCIPVAMSCDGSKTTRLRVSDCRNLPTLPPNHEKCDVGRRYNLCHLVFVEVLLSMLGVSINDLDHRIVEARCYS
jgi:hypothetical protein